MGRTALFFKRLFLKKLINSSATTPINMNDTMKVRCEWCGADPMYITYHDKDWGVPVHDDRKLFEMLILEGAQAGLSWLTILKKRQSYREAFDDFDPEKVAQYSQIDLERLLANPGIVRNRLKIESAIKNARGVLAIIEQFGTSRFFSLALC